VNARYTGTTTATVTGATLTGTSAIVVTSSPTLPLTLLSNASATFTIQYLPTTGTSVSTVVSINFTENSQASAFAFNLIGNAPDLAFSYAISPGGTSTALNSGDRISFPATNLGSSVSAVVTVLNRGSAAGLLQSATASNADFQIADLVAPASLSAGQQ